MRRLRIGMAQINTTVGDFDGNTKKILEATKEARSLGIDNVLFNFWGRDGRIALALLGSQ